MNKTNKIFLGCLLTLSAFAAAIGVYEGIHRFKYSIPPVNVVTIEQMRSETVLIEGETSVGSGVIFSSNEVLTAGHVAKDMGKGKIMVTFFNGEKVPAVVEWESKDADIAILSLVIPKGYQPALLACRTPIADEEVIAIGNPMALRWMVSRGRILTDRPLQLQNGAPANMKNDAATLIPFDAVVAPGASGGPIFDSIGELIGNIDAIMVEAFGDSPQTFHMQASTINFMVPSKFFCGSELKKA